MADDDDTIYIDVAARLDEDSVDKETKRLRDRLKDGVKGAGKAISDVLHSELAGSLSEAIGPVARSAGEELAKELGSRAGDFLHDQLSGALKDVGVDFDDITDKAKTFGGVFQDIKAGDTAKGFTDLTAALKGMPGPLGEVGDKSATVLDTYKSLKGDLHDTTEALGLFVAGIPAAETALAGLSSAAELALAPLAAFFGTMQIASGLTHGAQIDPWASGNPDPTKGFQSPIQAQPGVPLPPGPGGAPAAPPGYTATPGSLDPFSGLLPPGMQTPSGGTPSIAPPDTGGLPAHTSSAITGDGTHHASLVDSISGAPGGGGYTQDQAAAAIIGAARGRGLNQEQTLAALSVGLLETNLGSNPMTNVAQNQSGTVVQGLFQQDSSYNKYFGGGPRTDPQGGARGFIDQFIARGGLNKDPYQGAVDVQKGVYGPGYVRSFRGRAMDYYTRDGGSGIPTGGSWFPGYGGATPTPGRSGASPAGMGPGMPGIPGMPGKGGPGGPPSLGGNNSYSPNQQSQFGSGSGFGITGGGIIGAAEQAGSMAAGMGSFGGGSAAAAVAEQEMNLAITQGGKMAATAAMAPMETLGLAGGQMGAPSVGNGGWIHKLVGGMVGQQFSAPNMAGATQPPKQPDDKNKDADDGGGSSSTDPLNGNKSQGGQGGKGAKPGPTGHQDDPIHVQAAPGAAPQGSATSAMNATGVMSGSTV